LQLGVSQNKTEKKQEKEKEEGRGNNTWVIRFWGKWPSKVVYEFLDPSVVCTCVNLTAFSKPKTKN
jgi:hypothetical protein